MAIFQISSRKMLPTGQLKRSNTRLQRRWLNIVRIMGGLAIISALTTLVITFKLLIFLIFLPVAISIVFSRTQLHKIITGTFRYRFYTISLLTIINGLITGFQLLVHSPTTPEILLVTSSLAYMAMLDPLRIRIQGFIEQHFSVHDYQASKAIEAFTSTLREEIDLDQLRDRLFVVIQETMQPQTVFLWVRKVVQHAVDAQEEPSEVDVVDDDPLIAYALSHPGVIEVERLQLNSPVLQRLQNSEVSIVLPLGSQGELIGLLNLGPRLNGEDYTREDRTLLTMLAAQVAPALRVTQMVYERQAQVLESERIEQELRMAQDIQHTFLPKEIPNLPGWQVAPYYRPAREVGGDFYDFIPFEDGRLGLVIGDVTDKGMPAALVMTATRTMLRTAAQQHTSPGQVLARVNDLLYADIPSNMFVTCFYAILDPQSGQLHYANAGHEPPFRRQATGTAELWATGMPLGMLPGTRYDEYATTLAPGEYLLFYSDGLVEAHNTQHDMFGFPRLTACIAEHSGGCDLIDYLLNKLSAFTGPDWEQEDDVTMVVLQRLNAIIET